MGGRKKRRRKEPVEPGPEPDPRVVVWTGQGGPPWTDEQLEQIVERAIRFIEDAQRRWGRSLGLAVGEWLYVNLYRRNDAYLRSRHPGKDRSLYDIARRTGYDVRTLRTWVWAACMKLALEREGFSSERLMQSDWAALYQLRDMPFAARKVAEWIDRENPTIDEVREHVRLWREHAGRPPRRKRKKRDGPRRRRKPDELRLLRIMRIVHRWVREAEFGPQARSNLLEMVRRIRALLQEGA